MNLLQLPWCSAVGVPFDILWCCALRWVAERTKLVMEIVVQQEVETHGSKRKAASALQFTVSNSLCVHQASQHGDLKKWVPRSTGSVSPHILASSVTRSSPRKTARLYISEGLFAFQDQRTRSVANCTARTASSRLPEKGKWSSVVARYLTWMIDVSLVKRLL